MLYRPMKTSSDFQTMKLTRLAALGLPESEFEEKFARASGPGGQHVNKVSTAVSLRHLPSGVAVVAQDSRSQAMNRQTAWLRLLSAIEKQRAEQKAERISAREKLRRQNAKRPWGVKMRILDGKKRRAQTKKLRSKDW